MTDENGRALTETEDWTLKLMFFSSVLEARKTCKEPHLGDSVKHWTLELNSSHVWLLVTDGMEHSWYSLSPPLPISTCMTLEKLKFSSSVFSSRKFK